jgi:hypothetical protein
MLRTPKARIVDFGVGCWAEPWWCLAGCMKILTEVACEPRIVEDATKQSCENGLERKLFKEIEEIGLRPEGVRDRSFIEIFSMASSS